MAWVKCHVCDGWGYNVVVGRNVECGRCLGKRKVWIGWRDWVLLLLARKLKSLVGSFGG